MFYLKHVDYKRGQGVFKDYIMVDQYLDYEVHMY